MKRVSLKFIIFNIGIILIIGLLLGSASYFIIGTKIFSWQWHFMYGCLISVSLLGYLVVHISSKMIMKRTIKEYEEICDFRKCSTFEVVNGIFKIDISGGRLAYITKWNPFDFQVIYAKEISDIKSNYQKGPFGGTRYLYAEFYFNGKLQRIPIFWSRQTHSLASGEVRSAAIAADKIVKCLEQAKATQVIAGPESRMLIE